MSLIIKPDLHDYEFDNITKVKGSVKCPHCNKTQSQRFVEVVLDNTYIIILIFCSECEKHYKLDLERV